jgi:plastocyanin
MHARLLVAVAFLLSVAAAGCRERPAVTGSMPRQHTVYIEGMAFQPSTVALAPGDSVVWVNKDLVPHAAAAAGAFDSKALQFNTSFSHTFPTVGEFPYVCPFHPTMKGQIQVR